MTKLSGPALVEAAREFATQAHAGQFRRDGVTPYINHPAKVVALLTETYQSLHKEPDPVVLAVAWLHNVVEDTKFSAANLYDAGFPHEVVRAVVWLTKSQRETYEEFIAAIARDPIATLVKVADILANLRDDPTPKQVEKYTKAILFLSAYHKNSV